jgi:hypothetical protein
VTSRDTWWFVFFAWSLKSSLPFSGYVNTGEKKENRHFVNPDIMLKNTNEGDHLIL